MNGAPCKRGAFFLNVRGRGGDACAERMLTRKMVGISGLVAEVRREMPLACVRYLGCHPDGTCRWHVRTRGWESEC